uniref:Uncharacterized protein n=1 Tax=Romanomermis culicivorax TaxID=13658 RepID=A0A915IR42_ROMCU
MQREFEEGMALMKAKMEQLKHNIRFQREEDITLVVEQRTMEPLSLMKVDDDIVTDKLIIEEDVVEMLDSEMMD